MSKQATAMTGGILLAFLILSACQPGTTPAVTVEVEPLVEPYLSETPVPECVSLPNVRLEVNLLSKNGVRIKVTGLEPNEPVHVIFTSQAKDAGKMIEYGVGEAANEEGVYESTMGLRAPNVDVQFTDWEVRVIHSGISTCAEFILS